MSENDLIWEIKFAVVSSSLIACQLLTFRDLQQLKICHTNALNTMRHYEACECLFGVNISWSLYILLELNGRIWCITVKISFRCSICSSAHPPFCKPALHNHTFARIMIMDTLNSFLSLMKRWASCFQLNKEILGNSGHLNVCNGFLSTVVQIGICVTVTLLLFAFHVNGSK